MKSAVLKGKGQTYFLEIIDSSDFSEALIQVQELLKQIQTQTPTQQSLDLTVDTQTRWLNLQQKKDLKAVIAQFPVFKLQQIVSQVIPKSVVQQHLLQGQLELETRIIRSGQIMNYPGNVLLLGDVHTGAQVRAAGSVFAIGSIEGIVCAGYPNNDTAVVVGDMTHASQVRICDLIQIVSDIDDKKFDAKSFFYVNDLHSLTTASLDQLLKIRPQMEIILN